MSTSAALISTHTLSAPFNEELAKIDIVAIFDQAPFKQKKTQLCHRLFSVPTRDKIHKASDAGSVNRLSAKRIKHFPTR
jgi:hypothetical protein